MRWGEMKLQHAQIHNFRSIADTDFAISDYTLLVGANNAGKSNFLHALRAFYGEVSWSSSDVPKFQTADDESWMELTFELAGDEWGMLADKYKDATTPNKLRVRRYFRSAEKDRVKANQSNIYGYVNGALENSLFYGAKSVAQAKLGQIVYVPALTTIDEQTKLSGPSPLRDVLNYLLKKIVANSPSYAALSDAFQKLNDEARGEKGILNEIAKPLNAALSDWSIAIDFSINPVRPEEISKNLVSFSFLDSSLGGAAFDLNRYGHGFQRSVIYELIRLAPTFRDTKVPEKKEFSPDLTIILFEEPEAFLHPAQQENMAYHLRRLAADASQQVLICTHSSTFVGKASEDIGQLIRFRREGGITLTSQADKVGLQSLFADGGALLTALQAFVADPGILDANKKRARKLIANPPAPTIAEDEERFRFQMWLDSERASLFFADRVLLVEGASERALFSYLLSGPWHDLCQYKVCIVDVLGKFNFHRYMSLMKVFQIPFGIILDDDNNKEHHQAINDLVDNIASQNDCPILAKPEKVQDCTEVLLGLPKLEDRSDKKPIEILKAISAGGVAAEKLNALRDTFVRALALH
jgi:predicted ATP-dependent endonuclease of OLD family